MVFPRCGYMCQARHGNTAKPQDIPTSPPDPSLISYFECDVSVSYTVSLVQQRRTNVAQERFGQLQGGEEEAAAR